MVAPYQIHYSCCSRYIYGWSNVENSEEIKPVALSILELHLAEGISQLLKKYLKATWWNGSELKHIWLNQKCDCIYENRSKLHIGSYEIIDFKDFKAL